MDRYARIFFFFLSPNGCTLNNKIKDYNYDFSFFLYYRVNCMYMSKILYCFLVGFRWVSFLSFGEGWHNNHHAFEYSAKYGLEWWQLDCGWYVIMFLKVIGVATDVKLPTQSHKQRMTMNKSNEGSLK